FVPRRIDEGRAAGECAIERGTHPPVGATGNVLARYPFRARDRIHRADEGQGNPEPWLDVPQRKDVILPPEVSAVHPTTRERMVGHHDHDTLAGGAQCRHFGWQDHIFPLRNIKPWLWIPLP